MPTIAVHCSWVLSHNKVSKKPLKYWFRLYYWLLDHHNQKSDWYDLICVCKRIDRIMNFTTWNIRNDRIYQCRHSLASWNESNVLYYWSSDVSVHTLLSAYCTYIWGTVSIMYKYTKCVHAWSCVCSYRWVIGFPISLSGPCIPLIGGVWCAQAFQLIWEECLLQTHMCSIKARAV